MRNTTYLKLLKTSSYFLSIYNLYTLLRIVPLHKIKYLFSDITPTKSNTSWYVDLKILGVPIGSDNSDENPFENFNLLDYNNQLLVVINVLWYDDALIDNILDEVYSEYPYHLNLKEKEKICICLRTYTDGFITELMRYYNIQVNGTRSYCTEEKQILSEFRYKLTKCITQKL